MCSYRPWSSWWCNNHHLLLFCNNKPPSPYVPYVYIDGCGPPDHGPHGRFNHYNHLLLLSSNKPPSPYANIDGGGTSDHGPHGWAIFIICYYLVVTSLPDLM